jgi:hypothetical protein
MFSGDAKEGTDVASESKKSMNGIFRALDEQETQGQ